MRYRMFLMKLREDMKSRGITQKDILEHYSGMSTATLSNFFNGKSLTKDTMEKVINYIDDPKNWNKPKEDARKKGAVKKKKSANI